MRTFARLRGQRLIILVSVVALTLAACTRATPTPATPTATPTLRVPTAQATVTARTAILPTAGTPFTPATAVINGHELKLEVAATEAQRQRGLMARTSIPDDYAMLFVYERDNAWTFWMKDTVIPLDIVWVRAGGAVVDIQTMAPEARDARGDYRVYTPSGPARLVLEMNAGLARTYDIKPGTQVDFFP